MTDTRKRPSLRQALLVAAGLLALGLGLIGVVLPGLPTTPFVLLARLFHATALYERVRANFGAAVAAAVRFEGIAPFLSCNRR